MVARTEWRELPTTPKAGLAYRILNADIFCLEETHCSATELRGREGESDRKRIGICQLAHSFFHEVSALLNSTRGGAIALWFERERRERPPPPTSRAVLLRSRRLRLRKPPLGGGGGCDDDEDSFEGGGGAASASAVGPTKPTPDQVSSVPPGRP